MIGILLDNNDFEQDIRELLMAFYPGETFVREPNEDCRFSLTGRLSPAAADGGDEPVFRLSFDDAPEDGEMISLPETAVRLENKNRVKRGMYRLLVRRTGRELPWGTLTGIRPTKIPTTMLEQGESETEIRRYMEETYLTSREKTDLSIEIAKEERRILQDIHYQDGYSLYIGIPFCPTTCLYCSFTSYPISKWKKKTDLYLEALFSEMEDLADQMKGRPLDTVYFGGGTPTSLSAGELSRLLKKLEELFDLSQVKELTVEAGRPDSITEEKLRVLRKHGVTRISINPQTMKQETLDLIGRHHTVDQVKEQFALARSLGFDNINMDLIIGLPGETLEDVERTMEEIKRLDPDSVTVHSLALKRASRLNLLREQYAGMSGGDPQEMIELTARCAREMGMKPYYLYRQKNMAGNFENVGYARPGKAGVYNILIMEEKQTIAACGAGTTTKALFPAQNRIERWENVKAVEQYIDRLEEMKAKKRALLERERERFL